MCELAAGVRWIQDAVSRNLVFASQLSTETNAQYIHLASPVHFVAMVAAVGDHDVPVLRHGHALGTVQRAGEGVDEGEEGAGRVKHLKRSRL